MYYIISTLFAYFYNMSNTTVDDDVYNNMTTIIIAEIYDKLSSN